MDVDGGDSAPAVAAAEWSESADEARERFEVELEFVQCLSSPRYLMYLAQEGLLDDPAFIEYLSYLRYWKRPEYVTFIRYPQSLYFLDRLQDPTFRAEARNPQLIQLIDNQQYYHWAHYRHNRDRDAREKKAAAADGEGEAGAPASADGGDGAIASRGGAGGAAAGVVGAKVLS